MCIQDGCIPCQFFILMEGEIDDGHLCGSTQAIKIVDGIPMCYDHRHMMDDAQEEANGKNYNGKWGWHE